MKTDALLPRVEQRVRFTLRERRGVPSTAGCYVLASASDDVLYVGLASNLQRRLCQHREDEAKRQAVTGLVAAWFYFYLCEERSLKRVERGWMNQYEAEHAALPPLNRVHSPIS